MSTVKTHYPSYNVLDHMDEWDSHTKEIVRKRLGPFPENEFFTEREAGYIALISRHIVYDNRQDILSWVTHHIDSRMKSEIGEDQRKPGTPEEKILIRDGLKALDRVARLSFGKDFGQLSEEKQFNILSDLQLSKAAQIHEWSYIPQKELFKKLASRIVSAYYSHPTVWSEIGYGGPAYPRGYIRSEFGLTDPWEAKRDGK
ncbi:MAG: gluconate 2-dehydrogenase subunit 3 family protein [Eubacteriales bacterium]